MSGFTVVIQDDKKMWLAVWEGDPGRTFCKESARVYKTRRGAAIGLGIARKYRELEAAYIEEA